jgi:hypothetical protein
MLHRIHTKRVLRHRQVVAHEVGMPVIKPICPGYFNTCRPGVPGRMRRRGVVLASAAAAMVPSATSAAAMVFLDGPKRHGHVY